MSSAKGRWTERLAALYQATVGADLLELLPLLTVVLLLQFSPPIWYLRIPVVLICVAGIACRPLLQATPYWYTLAALQGAAIYLNWETADNHRYLICYWSLALCCVYSVDRRWQLPALAHNGRLLIGLCMLLATFWKLVSPDYLDGSFFQYELLADPRFEHVARWTGGAEATALADNRALRTLLTRGYQVGIETNSVQLAGSAWLPLLARLFTWWTIGLEAALALLFLWPRANRPAIIARNVLLLTFAVTTYSVAPVVGFGWVLMLLGMTQCGSLPPNFRLAYLGAFLLIQAYAIPYGPLVDLVVGR